MLVSSGKANSDKIFKFPLKSRSIDILAKEEREEKKTVSRQPKNVK